MNITETTNKPRLLTVKQAAAEYDNLTEWGVRQMLKNGELTPFKRGRKILIPSNAIEYVLFGRFDNPK